MIEELRRMWEGLKDLGPGLFIAALMLYGLYKLLYKIATNVGLKIVGALEKPSEALSLQAKSMDRLTTSLEQFVGRDQSEHREIIILQKVMLEKIEHLRGDRDGGDKKGTI
jgi:hypothetical protein